MFAGQLPDLPFPDLLTRLSEEARLGGSYFLCQQGDVLRVAKALEQVSPRLYTSIKPAHMAGLARGAT